MINTIRGCIMKAKQTDLLDWQQRYGTEEACTQALALQRWPEGFLCPRCGHDHGYTISTRRSFECTQCHYQASLTAGAQRRVAFAVGNRRYTAPCRTGDAVRQSRRMAALGACCHRQPENFSAGHLSRRILRVSARVSQ